MTMIDSDPVITDDVEVGVISAGAAAWPVPRLSPDINDAWHDAPPSDDCGAVRASLQR